MQDQTQGNPSRHREDPENGAEIPCCDSVVSLDVVRTHSLSVSLPLSLSAVASRGSSSARQSYELLTLFAATWQVLGCLTLFQYGSSNVRLTVQTAKHTCRPMDFGRPCA